MVRVLLALMLVCFSAYAVESEYKDELRRDFSLRNLGPLEITNMRGGIELRGWALDKVRVVVRRVARAESPEEARALRDSLDVRFQPIDGRLELSVEYGKGMAISEKIRERSNPKIAASVTVWAPSHLPTKVWATQGEIRAQNWNGPLEARSSGGSIRVDQIRAETVSLLCPTCEIFVRDLRGNLRAMGGSGKVSLFNVQSHSLYVETITGEVDAARVFGDQLYVTQSGRIRGQDIHGGIEFHSISGEVRFEDASGSLSGRTETGAVLGTFRSWKFRDKAVIESRTGALELALPSDFSGDLELFSGAKKPEIAANVSLMPREKDVPIGGSIASVSVGYGPQPLHANLERRVERVGVGGEILHLLSREGEVKIRRYGGVQKK